MLVSRNVLTAVKVSLTTSRTIQFSMQVRLRPLKAIRAAPWVRRPARMDPYVEPFQANGGSLVMIAKGNRTQAVTDACQKHGGFYLGTIGGVAAVLSSDSIKSIECIEYPELGMEAVYKIEVENFPAFILVDDKGNDFFKQLKPVTIACKKA